MDIRVALMGLGRGSGPSTFRLVVAASGIQIAAGWLAPLLGIHAEGETGRLKRSHFLQELTGKVHLSQFDTVSRISPDLAQRTRQAQGSRVAT